jgi:hypothetical protein
MTVYCVSISEKGDGILCWHLWKRWRNIMSASRDLVYAGYEHYEAFFICTQVVSLFLWSWQHCDTFNLFTPLTECTKLGQWLAIRYLWSESKNWWHLLKNCGSVWRWFIYEFSINSFICSVCFLISWSIPFKILLSNTTYIIFKCRVKMNPN